MTMVDGNKLGEVGFNKLGTPYKTMDCQAFVEWCLKQCGENTNLAGSNAWYREVYKNGLICTPEACVEMLGTVPPGAFLFIWEENGAPSKYTDGLGNASHIGLCTGKKGKGAIHSSYSKGCVCESEFHNKTVKNGGWNRVGLWDKVNYDYSGGDTPTPGPEPTPGPSPEPEPAPEPVPEPTFKTVWSENGLGVNTRKGPGTGYAQAGPGKLKVGTVVEVVKTKGDWSRILYTDSKGKKWDCWMASQFLIDPEPEPDPSTTLYTVTIKHLPLYQAEALKERYDGAVIVKEDYSDEN